MEPFSPNQKLSEDVVVTDKFRIEFNKWLEDFFGSSHNFYVIEENTMFGQPYGRCIVTHPDNVKLLKIHSGKKLCSQ